MNINCKDKLINLEQPRVMGILNLTPDSFFEQSRSQESHRLLSKAGMMLEQGADFLDLGGYSSRPGAEFVSCADELERVLPAVKTLMAHFPDALLSIDTFRSEVAAACVGEGAALVNDISAGWLDPEMMAVVASLQVPYIMMHMRGTPQTMQQYVTYDDLPKAVLQYFSERVCAARSLGINDLIVDPGFGFSKTLDQNYELLQQLELLQLLELPLLVGVSRKSMITKALEINATDALNGTTVLHTIALTKGAKILRVHDVKEALEAVRIWQLLERQS